MPILSTGCHSLEASAMRSRLLGSLIEKEQELTSKRAPSKEITKQGIERARVFGTLWVGQVSGTDCLTTAANAANAMLALGNLIVG